MKVLISCRARVGSAEHTMSTEVTTTEILENILVGLRELELPRDEFE
jgi:hypothetical protein